MERGLWEMERGVNRGMEVERGMERGIWRDGGRERDGGM